MNISKEISRKKFFGILGLTSAAAFVFSSTPFKIIKSVTKKANKKNVNISIHPSAVKRINKV